MPSIRRANGQTISTTGCELMSNEELYRFLKTNLPAAADTLRGVNDANREEVIDFLKFISDAEE